MTEDRPLIQVKVFGTAPEAKEVEKAFRGELEGYEVIVTTDDIDLKEVPAMDDYLDELVDRMEERLTDSEDDVESRPESILGSTRGKYGSS
jgi:hypothetical protein